MFMMTMMIILQFDQSLFNIKLWPLFYDDKILSLIMTNEKR